MSFSLDTTEEIEQDPVEDIVEAVQFIGAPMNPLIALEEVCQMREAILIVENFNKMSKLTLEIEDVEKFLVTVNQMKKFEEFLDQRTSQNVQA